MSLANKYRPKEMQEIIGQESVIKVLTRQLDNNEFKNCYLFAGPSGCGKTSIARIFADMINKHTGRLIEIDGASNNGVDNIRKIIDDSKERSIDSEYKIYLIDEAHQITSAGWNAFLKCLEEPPKHTIYLFCTTAPQKIPESIMNRLMVFYLSRVSPELINKRLLQISLNEKFINYQTGCEYISKISDGSVRQAISLLEKCSSFSNDLSINNILSVLGVLSYDSLFDLTNAIIDKDEINIIKIIDNYYNQGNDIKVFIDQYMNFIFDVTKYCITNTVDFISIPMYFEKDNNSTRSLQYITNIYENKVDNIKFYNYILNGLLDIKNKIHHDTNMKTTTEIMLLSLSRNQK